MAVLNTTLSHVLAKRVFSSGRLGEKEPLHKLKSGAYFFGLKTAFREECSVREPYRRRRRRRCMGHEKR